jgi:hypothetical protein
LLFSDRACSFEVDRRRSVEDFLRTDKLLFVKSPLISINFKDPKGNEFVVRDVPASARGFDPRKKVAESIKWPFCKLHLAYYRFYIEDPNYLGELGIYTDCCMRFAILEQGLCRLFFVLFGATQMATSYPMG